MNPVIDWVTKLVRTAAVVTGSYVAGTILDIQDYNQAVILWNVTLGSLTSAELKIEFSHDASTYFQETTESAPSSGVVTDTVIVHTVTADGKYRIPVPIADKKLKISVKGTGTVTSSSVGVDVELAKNYA